MHRLLLPTVLLIPMLAHADKAFMTEWETKTWTGSRFCAVGAFEDKPGIPVKFCAEQQGGALRSLGFESDGKTYQASAEALAGLPELRLEEAVVTVSPCGSWAATPGQPLKPRGAGNCYLVMIPTRQDALKMAVVSFEGQRFIAVKVGP